ncbi:MAG: hypothetical protein V1861_00920 [Candidatus Micrarchaeota archaeon]
MPLYEAFALAASDLANPASMMIATEQALANFNSEAGSALASKIDFHARRFHEGFYANVDTSGREQDRMIGVLCIAIYLTEVVRKMWPLAKKMGDSGTAALFDETLEHAKTFLSEGYYEKRPQEVARAFESVRPALAACLRRCGMENEPTDMEGIIGTYVNTLVQRSTESFRRLEQSAEASI